MNNLHLAFTVVFPLFFMMALGYGLRAIGLFNEEFLKQLNNLCFQVFLPLLLFVNIYTSDFQGSFRPGLLLFALGSVLCGFLVLMGLVPLVVKENFNRGVVIQGIFRSNFILFGMPITLSLYGSENTSVTAILIAFTVPFVNALSVVALETFSSKKSGFKSIVKGIFKNPLVIASLCAFLIVFIGLKIPVMVESALIDISKIATPFALIILGGSFQFRRLTAAPGLLATCVFGKLIALPSVFLTLAILLGFRGLELTALMALLSSPTAVSSYTMAQSAGANGELAAQIVVVDSTLSIVTIFLWITLLKGLLLI